MLPHRAVQLQHVCHIHWASLPRLRLLRLPWWALAQRLLSHLPQQMRVGAAGASVLRVALLPLRRAQP